MVTHRLYRQRGQQLRTERHSGENVRAVHSPCTHRQNLRAHVSLVGEVREAAHLLPQPKFTASVGSLWHVYGMQHTTHSACVRISGVEFQRLVLDDSSSRSRISTRAQRRRYTPREHAYRLGAAMRSEREIMREIRRAEQVAWAQHGRELQRESGEQASRRKLNEQREVSTRLDD